MNDNNKKLLRIIAIMTLVFGYIAEGVMAANVFIAYAFTNLYRTETYHIVFSGALLSSIGLLCIVFVIALIMLILKKYDRAPGYDRNFRLKFELHTNDVVAAVCAVFLPLLIWLYEIKLGLSDGQYYSTAPIIFICQLLVLLVFFYYDAYLEQFTSEKRTV